MMASRIIVGLVAIVLAVIAYGQSSSATRDSKMKITSSAFQQGANISSKFSCDGADTSHLCRFKKFLLKPRALS